MAEPKFVPSFPYIAGYAFEQVRCACGARPGTGRLVLLGLLRMYARPAPSKPTFMDGQVNALHDYFRMNPDECT